MSIVPFVSAVAIHDISSVSPVILSHIQLPPWESSSCQKLVLHFVVPEMTLLPNALSLHQSCLEMLVGRLLGSLRVVNSLLGLPWRKILLISSCYMTLLCGTRLHIPAGILRIPVFSVPINCFSQESQFSFRSNLVYRKKKEQKPSQ